jgi:hypothetical protein
VAEVFPSYGLSLAVMPLTVRFLAVITPLAAFRKATA